MPRWLAGTLLTSLLAGGTAATVAAQPQREAGAAAARLAATALQRCPRLSLGLPAEDELEDWGRELEAELDGDVLLVRDYAGGQGVDAEHGIRTTLVHLDRCVATAAETAWWDGARLAPARIEQNGGGRPAAADVARVAGELADPTRPEHAAGLMLVTTSCDIAELAIAPGERFALTRALAPAQPWMPGRPRAAPALYWTRSVLRQMGAPVDAGVLDGGAATPDGVVSFAVPTPARLLGIEGLELWQATLGGRNGGVALAIYDPAADRHRWVVATAHCHPDVEGAFLLATTVAWTAHGDGLLVGRATSRHPVYEGHGGTVVLDLERGVVHRLIVERRVPVPIRDIFRALRAIHGPPSPFP